MANGESRFLVLNKLSDWEEGQSINLSISDDGLSIKSTTEYAKVKEIEWTVGSEGKSAFDFVIGQCSTLYVLNRPERRIGLYDLEQETCECIECIGTALSKPEALACTSRTLFVSDTESTSRILAFARINWQIRWVVGPAPISSDGKLVLEGFTPTCLCVDDDENLYVYDSKNFIVAKFDPAGVMVDSFKINVPNDSTVTSLAVTSTALLVLIDSKNPKVFRIEFGAPETVETLIDFENLGFSMKPGNIAMDKQGVLYFGDSRTDPQGDEDNRFIHMFNPNGGSLGLVTGYRGAVTKLAIDRQGRIIILNSSNGKLVILDLKKILSRLPGQTLPAGTFFTRALDSTQPGTLWHKVVLDAETPPNTQVKVFFYTDDKGEFTRVLTDPQTTLEQKKELPWSREPIVNPRDALFLENATAQPPKGRYLWLRLEILGNKENAPTVRSIRAYFPRESYLRYLPAIYQEESVSRNRLERYLSVFETLFGGTESQIRQIVRYFDVQAVPRDFLDWLASWLAVQIDEVWNEEKKRAFLQRSPELFSMRGTREGIETMIEILTGDRPYLIEQFRLYSVPLEEEVEEVLKRLYGIDPHSFTVLLKQSQVKSDDERKALQRLIEAEKPAHTHADVHVLEPWIYLDWHTYLEINTYLSKPTLRLDGGAVMPRDLLLSDFPEAGQIERRSRVELDTELT